MPMILFATTNKRKINEANKTLRSYDITIEPIAIDIDEIQHHDPSEITKAKAKAAFAAVNAPVVVSDTSWSITSLGGFPGGYMKDVNKWLGEEDWMALMARHDDRTILCFEHLAYFDGTTLKHFAHEYTASILREPAGPFLPGLGPLERVISFDTNGEMSLAERIETNSGPASFKHWEKFAQWYTEDV